MGVLENAKLTRVKAMFPQIIPPEKNFVIGGLVAVLSPQKYRPVATGRLWCLRIICHLQNKRLY